MKANTVELQNQATQLREVVLQMMETRQAVLRTGEHLMEESIGEQFRPVIQAQADDMERLAMDVLRLRWGLEETARAYENCENRIIDRAEQEDSGAYRFRPDVISVPTLNVGNSEPHPQRGFISDMPWRPAE